MPAEKLGLECKMKPIAKKRKRLRKIVSGQWDLTD
jgi:hypothetical protein